MSQPALGRPLPALASDRSGRAAPSLVVLAMAGEGEGGADTDMPSGLLAELDSAVNLNDLLLVQDFVANGIVEASFALHRASYLECTPEMLDMLLDAGADIDWADRSGRSPLMCAVTRKSLYMSAILLDRGADVEYGGSSYSGRTPLMMAASAGNKQLVELLLDAGADPNAEDRFGRSVVMQASMMNHKPIVRRLEKLLDPKVGLRSKTAALLGGGQKQKQVEREEPDLMEVDDEFDIQLWSSLMTEALPVDGRPDLFQWRGRLMRQPEPLADGGLVIIDDESGEIVYKGFPPPPGAKPSQATAQPDTTARTTADVGGQKEPSGAVDTRSYSVVKTAARLAISPAVAVTRIANAGAKTIRGTLKGEARDDEREAQVQRQQQDVYPGFKSMAEHQQDVERVAEQVAHRGEDQLITLRRGKGDSHCPRSEHYKADTLQVDVSSLDGILAVDQVAGGGWQALVEPRVTMEKLVRAVLPLGLVPEVVPEFRRITVGGSVQGIAGESTSFDKGFFHDSCDSYELVLGDGSVVLATATNEYSDLFYALPGTYGTLGILTAATVRLRRAQPYVAMEYLPFKLLGTMMKYVQSALNDDDFADSPVEFLEGFGYAPDKYLIAQGRFVGEEEALSGECGPVQKYSKFYSPWFYLRARKRQGKRDVIPTEDYLFRHDRGSFWMASYKMPHLVGRAMGWALPSYKMYKMASALPGVFDKSEILLQDFMIPTGNVEAFVETLDDSLGVWPLWFCPLRNMRKKGLIFGVPANGGHFCNVGAYGIPRKVKFDFERDNKLMEMAMLENGGRKVHYSHAYYPQDLFYGRIYDGEYYAELRARYMAEGGFPHVHEKVVTRGNRL